MSMFDPTFASEVQENGQGHPTEDKYAHEVIGSIFDCTFEISTVIPPSTYRLDGRLATPLRPGMSAIDFQRILTEHCVTNIVFAWDVREMAREVFHLLAIDFRSNTPTIYPREVH